jgi:tetratricopeptide (TPR) repeat protein
MRRYVQIGLALALAVPSLAMGKPKDKAAVQSDFAKLVARVNDAKKASQGALPAANCQSAAKDFNSFGHDNKSAEAFFNAGVLLEECGSKADADRAYRDAVDANLNFAPPHVNLGEMAYRAGDLPRAQQEFDTALKLDPTNVQAYNDTALMLFEKSKTTQDPALLKDAIGKLRRALAVDADSIAAYSLLALVYYTVAESDRSKLDLAELVCKQAKEVNDKYPQIYNTLGLIKLKKKNVTGALGEFRQAATLDPKYIEAQLNIGAITLSARDYKSAEAAFDAVLKANPTNSSQKFDATMGMGVALRGQRRVDEAEKKYAEAKQLDPKACAVSYNLGVLYQDYKSGQEPDLTRAKQLFGEFNACGRADQEKLKDATRRMKDIDDTFKAIAEAKKMEEETKKMQEEADRMIKQQQEQEKLQQQQNPPPPDGKAPDGKGAPDAKDPKATPAPDDKAATPKAK